MGKYDAVLKLMLQRWGAAVMRKITTDPLTTWLNVEFPKVSMRYADLLAETDAGQLWHIELQSTNDAEMPARMLEYAARVLSQYGRLPKQAVLYIGRDSLRMKSEFVAEDLTFRYSLWDARNFDSEELLTSPSVGDNLMAILTRLRDSEQAVRRILRAIAGLDVGDRGVALQALTLLAGLRELEQTVEKEARKMPVFDDILDNKVLGREFKRGLAVGREEGRKEGREEGREEGLQSAIAVLRSVVEYRFGAVPEALEAQIRRMSPSELGQMARRALTAATVSELLSPASE